MVEKIIILVSLASLIFNDMRYFCCVRALGVCLLCLTACVWTPGRMAKANANGVPPKTSQ